MLRKRVVSVAVPITAGALSLAACGTQNAAQPPEQAPVDQIATTEDGPGKPEEPTQPEKPATSAILFDGRNFSEKQVETGMV